MNTPTTTDNKTLDLVNRIDAFVWDGSNFQDHQMKLFAIGLSGKITRSFQDFDQRAQNIADGAAYLRRNIDAGRPVHFNADSIARMSADLVVAQTNFNDNVDALRSFLLHLAQDDAARDAVAALFD